MKFHLILIGDELLEGRIQDLNAHWLARHLNSQGLSLSMVQMIGDSPDAITTAFDSALKVSDVVIVSGGLGPTGDDLTKAALAQFLHVPLVENPGAKGLAIRHYSRIDREWTAKLNDYHMIPKNVMPVHNPAGLAPGLLYHDASGNKFLMCAPGVPREFQAMVQEEFLPLLRERKLLKTVQPETMCLRTRGIPEEKIFGELSPGLWDFLCLHGKVSSLPQKSGVDIVVRLKYPESKKTIMESGQLAPLKKNIWQIGEQTLPEYLLNKAQEKSLTVGLAESCTGGLSASLLTDVAGSSEVFLGSVVTYSNQFKIDLLGVSPATIKKFGAVSEETASEMARGARQKLNCDFVAATSGIAGPTGGTKEKPVGMVCIAVAGPNGIHATTLHLKGDRLLLKERFAQASLHLLLEKIGNDPFGTQGSGVS